MLPKVISNTKVYKRLCPEILNIDSLVIFSRFSHLTLDCHSSVFVFVARLSDTCIPLA